MITTLRAIFEGRRELFDGLAIAGTDWAWEPHPVIKFNFAGVSTLTPEAFDATFPQHVRSCLEAAGYAYDPSVPASVNFARAIETLGADYKAGREGAKGVVVLIDEYDAPYRALGKPIWAIGLSFNRDSRRLVGHAVARLA